MDGSKPRELILVLDNIRSCYNVGAILRTAEGFGVPRVVLSGYTPRVHDSSLLPHLREKLDHEIHKTALGAEDMLDIYTVKDISKELEELRSDGWQIVGLENNIDDVPIYALNGYEIKNKISNKVVLVLGEEVDGISEKLYKNIDFFVEIPMCGQKESFNVSVAAGISMYGIMNL